MKNLSNVAAKPADIRKQISGTMPSLLMEVKGDVIA